MSDPAKTCPSCGEHIKAAAVICRFCRYDFRSPPPTPSQRRVQPRIERRRFFTALALTLGVGLLALATVVLLDARSDLTEARRELERARSRSADISSALERAQDTLDSLTQQIETVQKDNAALEKKIEKTTAPSDEGTL